ncbi:hypothetical protein ATCV1_z319L [Acanthocystis turfacea chlorella virus 1]|uniref:Uncharacterized protein z319L n=1 Tax=Chlorovirus heliozoae TaxID=322019 RepID=A7K8S9_9PHYC|nr:hypothetical protein ATCV1_z319L [Acanthocystis turfacea chlorella virus 1]ABT16453.1 hypothetical protein ATCV1_z319L [Acanthocystis turfacea chlorella virus 1]
MTCWSCATAAALVCTSGTGGAYDGAGLATRFIEPRGSAGLTDVPMITSCSGLSGLSGLSIASSGEGDRSISSSSIWSVWTPSASTEPPR